MSLDASSVSYVYQRCFGRSGVKLTPLFGLVCFSSLTVSCLALFLSGQSTQTFITALVLNLAIAGAEVVAFMLIRKKFKKIYEPRTYLVPPK